MWLQRAVAGGLLTGCALWTSPRQDPGGQEPSPSQEGPQGGSPGHSVTGGQVAHKVYFMCTYALGDARIVGRGAFHPIGGEHYFAATSWTFHAEGGPGSPQQPLTLLPPIRVLKDSPRRVGFSLEAPPSATAYPQKMEVIIDTQGGVPSWSLRAKSSSNNAPFTDCQKT